MNPDAGSTINAYDKIIFSFSAPMSLPSFLDGLSVSPEIEYSEEYGEYRIPLQSPVFNGKVSFVFLPGTDFDFKWFRFEK